MNWCDKSLTPSPSQPVSSTDPPTTCSWCTIKYWTGPWKSTGGGCSIAVHRLFFACIYTVPKGRIILLVVWCRYAFPTLQHVTSIAAKDGCVVTKAACWWCNQTSSFWIHVVSQLFCRKIIQWSNQIIFFLNKRLTGKRSAFLHLIAQSIGSFIF